MSGALQIFSGALVTTSPAKAATDRLKEAIKEFERNLSRDEKLEFHKLRSQSRSTAPTPQDVRQLTAQYDVCTAERLDRQCFGLRFAGFLSCVQQFAALGDILVGGSQNLVACGVWSLVRMCLMSIVNYSDHIAKLSDLFMDIGRSISGYEEIFELYPDSARLQEYWMEYYIKVVELCCRLYSFTQKSTFQKIASSLDTGYLENFKRDLAKWANLIKNQADIVERQKNAGIRELTTKSFRAATREKILETNRRVLKFCSTYDHESSRKHIRRVGKSSFFQQQPEYQAWRDNTHASTLLYKGKLGSGKSVLLANIVDDLSLSDPESKPLVVYFFCRHDIPQSLQARTIIGSLARQLLSTVKDLSVAAQSCDTTHTTDDPEKILEVLLQGFSSTARNTTKVYFVLDGLDECDTQERENIVQVLRQIQEELKIRVCASFREAPYNGLNSIYQKLLGTCVVSIPAENPDIEAFIDAELDSCYQQKRLIVGQPELIEEIRRALLKGSKGMFLWTNLQIKSLCSLSTDHAIREALSDLPRDLSETYARILHKAGGLNPELQAKTLQLILAAQRPLTTDELREAMSVIPGDVDWDTSKLLNSIQSALRYCGCLLVTDEEDFTVRVVHSSFQQYLLGCPTGYSLRAAQETLAQIVVTYLSYAAFGNKVSRDSACPIETQGVPAAIVRATLGPLGPGRDLATKLMRARQQSTIDIRRAVAGVRIAPEPKPEYVFKFYGYAKQYWQNHILHVTVEPSWLTLSFNLIDRRVPELEEMDHDKWMLYALASEDSHEKIVEKLLKARNFDTNKRDTDGRIPLMWAAENGWTGIVKVLLNLGITNVEVRNAYDYTPLMQAARYGFTDTVEILVNYGKADVNAEAPNGLTSLMLAVINRDKATVEFLINNGQVDVEARSGGCTALIQAAQAEYTDVVEVLLRKANVEAKQSNGWTSLMHAANNGDKDTVRVLLDVGKANVECEDTGGHTPLIQAARRGHKEIVQMLLLRKANVEAKNSIGQTSLIWAASNGDSHTVEVLLSMVDVDARTNNGRTALMEAVRHKHKEVVALLVDRADISATDDFGRTAMMDAEDSDEDIVELLRSHINRVAANKI